jgi:pimeloyl-ACP methyl ester carboxylesterase
MHININSRNIAVTHCNEYSKRPTLILLHDSLGCIALWRDFPKQLSTATQCNVLVYDRLGYGNSDSFITEERDNFYMESEADLLNDLLELFQIDEAILFGHSDGGTIALLTAAKYPNRIKAVITEGAHVFVEEITINGIKEAIIQYETTDLKQKLEKYHGSKTDALFWAWAKTWTSNTFRSWNIEHFLPLITCPTLIIQGTNDEYGTLNQVESICNNVSGKSKKLILDKIKHTPHKEASGLIIDECRQFIMNLDDNL